MPSPIRPRIRQLELVPLDDGQEPTYALRDPHGFAGTEHYRWVLRFW